MYPSEIIEMLEDNIQYYVAKLALEPTKAEKTQQQLDCLYARRRALTGSWPSKPGLSPATTA